MLVSHAGGPRSIPSSFEQLFCTKNINNKIIKSFATIKTNKEYSDKAKSGYFPVQYFTYFDQEGLIQDNFNTSIIYRMPRHMANKFISYKLEDWTFTNDRVYNTYQYTIPI